MSIPQLLQRLRIDNTSGATTLAELALDILETFARQESTQKPREFVLALETLIHAVLAAQPSQDQTTAAGDGSVTHQTQSGREPHKGFLADTRWSNQGWVSCELQMPEALAYHLAPRDSGDDPQRPR
jgi:hypothetical protein